MGASVWQRRHVRLALEVALIAALCESYEQLRLHVGRNVEAAYTNGVHILRVEQWLHLPSEASLQRSFLHVPSLVVPANMYYIVAHWTGTFLFLAWVFFRHPARYPWIRRSFLMLTFTAFAVEAAVPAAPPRLLPGFLDTARVYGPSVYGHGAVGDVANQFAAMPSLHVGWAALVAVGVIATMHSRWRWLALLYPATTLLVVVVTANHYFVDSGVALVLLVLALLTTRPNAIRRWRHGIALRVATPHP